MFKLVDKRPKSGPTINLKPYSGYSRLRKSNPRYIDNDTAIMRLQAYNDARYDMAGECLREID